MERSEGAAVPFITITDSPNDKSQPTFVLNKEAVEVLSSPILKNKKVLAGSIQLAIAAIAGPQRTGKSFLANLLLRKEIDEKTKMKGFAIGPSTIPCTKGIWIWNEPLKINEDTYMLLIDTEGLNSVRKAPGYFRTRREC